MTDTKRLANLDHSHVWHPFTPMRQWRAEPPLIIDRAEGFYLIDTEGNRYIDGVSSLWCNVHGHRVPEIDQAIRDQLDKTAHTTLLGLASPPSIEFAAMLCDRVNKELHSPTPDTPHPTPRLNKVFYSDAGATAVEVAFKMAIGYWHHTGHPEKNRFIGLAGAYHGDTTGSMSVGYSDLFHKPFISMVFNVTTFPAPHPSQTPPAQSPPAPAGGTASVCETKPHNQPFPSEDHSLCAAAMSHSLTALDALLTKQAHQTAAVVIEPVMQGAAGMICQPPGFVKGVRELCDKHNVLLIADEVATGFGRTGKLLACAHDQVTPDILCLAKGITGGYLPLAATLTTDAIEDAFTGTPDQRRTLYHGHTYTGNPLACAAAIASLNLFEKNNTLEHANQSAKLITEKLNALRDHPNVIDIRQRGLMVGIELCASAEVGSLKDEVTPSPPQPSALTPQPFNFAARTGAKLCKQMLPQGLIIRPLGDTLVLMPAPAMDHESLGKMLDIVVGTIHDWPAPG
ncbi:MAG: adenosylmethionine--8-amino-7-oxononanoate transaminase [Phycisphaerales bacterium]